MTLYFSIQDYPDTSELVSIEYGDKRRVIKRGELGQLERALNDQLTNHNLPSLKLKSGNQYSLTHLNQNPRLLSDIFETFGFKKRIELPSNLAYSHEGKYLVYTFRDLDQFRFYWKKKPSACPALFKQLSEDILEVPYADKPDDYVYRYGKVAFHVNHGSALGLRLSLLLLAIVNYLIATGDADQEMVTELKRLSEEEISCLQLAAFLMRSGRTNECGWKGDPTYCPRSAAIFKTIAISLGYDTCLVDAISQCFDFKQDIPQDSGFLKKPLARQHIKLPLFQKLFHIIHTLDLLRCNSNESYLKELVLSELQPFLNAQTNHDQSIEHLFSLAEELLTLTGSGVLYKFVQTQTMSGKENPFLQVSVVDELDNYFIICQQAVNSWLDDCCTNGERSERLVGVDSCNYQNNLFFKPSSKMYKYVAFHELDNKENATLNKNG